MKTLTKLSSLFALTVVVFAGTALRADDAPATPAPPAETPKSEPGLPPRLERRMKYLDANLKLSADQKAKIAVIWQKADDQLHKAQQSLEGANPQARRQKYREVMQSVHEQVRAELTPEQQKIFDALVPQNRRRAKPAGEV